MVKREWERGRKNTIKMSRKAINNNTTVIYPKLHIMHIMICMYVDIEIEIEIEIEIDRCTV